MIPRVSALQSFVFIKIIPLCSNKKLRSGWPPLPKGGEFKGGFSKMRKNNKLREKTKNLKFLISIISSVALIFLSGCGNQEKSSGLPVADGQTLTAYFLDVGQGDCSFFSLPDGKTMLIDAANPDDGGAILKYLKSLGVTRLDYLVATHPHADHIGGMAEIIGGLEIGQIFAPKINKGDIPATKTYERFLSAVKNKGLKITAAKSGLTLFETENYKATCLAPFEGEIDGLNNYSAVIKLTFGANSFLLTGDTEKEVEEQILNGKADIDCDVLKVAHHGSDSSSSREFLKKVSPKLAVISCGRDNSYGHPHKEPLERLRGIKTDTVLRTDLDKTVIVTSNGKDITFTKNNKSVIGD